jgi:chemotaxis protein CheC
LPLESATAELNLGDEMFVMVALSVEGPLGGELILMFDEENGRRLAATLLNRPLLCEGHWTTLEQSALTETGNILGCAYINALARLINHEMVPTAPHFLQDYGASVLEQALLVQAATSDEVLVSRTAFRREGEELHWHLLFVPGTAMRIALEQALHAGPLQVN